MNQNKLYLKVFLLTFMSILILSGCASSPPKPLRHNVQRVEKRCGTYSCYMERLGRYGHNKSVNEDGSQVILWHIRVTKTRPLGYGEVARSGMNYEYYKQDCWFTAVFDSNGNVLETEWDGPGCWGRGN